MDKLTLDTNLIRDWTWCEGKSHECRYSNDPAKRSHLKAQFETLKSLRDQGRCELGVTNQLFTDYEKDAGALPKHIEEMVGSFVTFAVPSISTFPMIFPLVFADPEEIDAIFTAVFPDSQPHHRRYKKNRKDALQLYAHKVAGRDYFLTSDERIIAASVTLSKKWNLHVMTLDEYLCIVSSKSS